MDLEYVLGGFEGKIHKKSENLSQIGGVLI
jgi:hypothetical protein